MTEMDERGMVLYRCPWCPVTVPVPPWKFETEGEPESGTMTFRVTRKAWELTMLDHWRDAHPEGYAEFGDQVRGEMGRDIEFAAGSIQRQLGEAAGRPAVSIVPDGDLRRIPPQMAVPPWVERQMSAIPSPEFDEFMRGWSGLR